MSDPSIPIVCPVHGESYVTFLCSHLIRSANQGFYSPDEPSSEDPRPDAWCYNCEISRFYAGGWTKKLEKEAKVKVLCANCYDTVKARNLVTRPSFEVDGWRLGDFQEVQPPIPASKLPTREEIRNLRTGDLVKLLFLILEPEPDGYCVGERMWVRIKRRSSEEFIGKLDNSPFTKSQLQRGQKILFQKDLILDIQKASFLRRFFINIDTISEMILRKLFPAGS